MSDTFPELPPQILTDPSEMETPFSKFRQALLDVGLNSEDAEDQDDDSNADNGSSMPVANRSQKIDALEAVVIAAVRAATTPASRRLMGRKAVAVVVSVPSTAWVRPVEAYFQGQPSSNWVTFARDGGNKLRDRPSVGNHEVSHLLSIGKSVVGIAANPDVMLPSSLMAAADLTIAIAPLTSAVVHDAMRRCLRGRLSASVDDAIVAGLELDDIVAAMRLDSSPKQVVQRLESAAAWRQSNNTSRSAPELETAVEFGAAREWAQALAKDVRDYRAGLIGWQDCDRGAVVFSDPGCGKSLLAASIANACQVPLVRASMADFFANNSGDLGAVINAQRAVFARAAACAPCILFLDEIDAIPNRATLSAKNRDWWLPVINDLLMLLDAAVSGQREGVIVIGATNRIEDVDAALLRPGRLERCIEITRPDLEGTENILRYHLGQSLLNVDITGVAMMLEGSTAAELMDTVRSARRAARRADRDLCIGDLQNQAMGPCNEAPDYLWRVAVHEATHAVLTVVIPVGTLVRVRLGGPGLVGGHTLVKYEDNGLPTLEDIEDRVTSLLSAGVAERLILGATSTGSGGGRQSDLCKATTLLSELYTGTATVGPLFYSASPEAALEAAQANPALRSDIERHLRKLEREAEYLVVRHRGAILSVAEELEARRHLSGDAVMAIIERGANRNEKPAPELNLPQTATATNS